MTVVKYYSCGNGDGMYEDETGLFVEKKDFDKMREYMEELFEIASNNCKGLAHDELFEIVEKYE
jgi:hypothetical protein